MTEFEPPFRIEGRSEADLTEIAMRTADLRGERIAELEREIGALRSALKRCREALGNAAYLSGATGFEAPYSLQYIAAELAIAFDALRDTAAAAAARDERLRREARKPVEDALRALYAEINEFFSMDPHMDDEGYVPRPVTRMPGDWLRDIRVALGMPE